MVFSSLTFLIYFLPLCLGTYFVVPKKYIRARNFILLIFSLLFYAWGEPVYVALMFYSIALDYTCGRIVEKYRGSWIGKVGLIISITGNLGLLMVFKYSDFFIGTINNLTTSDIPLLNLALPIGISFYTFQTMSYTIDVYRKEVPAQKNILDFAAYVTLFPQLIAGPIVRYKTVAEELEHRESTADLFAQGAKRFVCGLGKKILLANNIGLLWETVSSQSEPTILSAWLGVIAYGFQIYFDFSGYSDMAIGLGRMFGFHFLENFNYPFMATSISDFWRRWHISMGSWFRDYVYIPLGGNKGGLIKQLRNIAIVWFLTGLWHGASWNYILWGIYFGALLLLEKIFLLKLINKLPKFLQHIYTLFLLTLSWNLFAFTDVHHGMEWFRSMFSGAFADRDSLYLLLSYGPMLLLCVIASMPLINGVRQGIKGKKGQYFIAIIECLSVVVVFVLSIAYLVSGSYNPFLYFRF